MELECARPQTAGEEELQLQLALAMSREEAEQEDQKKKSDDVRLQLALSQSENEFKWVIEKNLDPNMYKKFIISLLKVLKRFCCLPDAYHTSFAQRKNRIRFGF